MNRAFLFGIACAATISAFGTFKELGKDVGLFETIFWPILFFLCVGIALVSWPLATRRPPCKSWLHAIGFWLYGYIAFVMIFGVLGLAVAVLAGSVDW